MSPSPANKLTSDIISFLYRQGAYAWRASSTGTYDQKTQSFRTAPKKGVSDILACLPTDGRLLAIEVKIGADRLSPEQSGFIKNIQHVGGLATVAKDLPSFVGWYSKNILQTPTREFILEEGNIIPRE